MLYWLIVCFWRARLAGLSVEHAFWDLRQTDRPGSKDALVTIMIQYSSGPCHCSHIFLPRDRESSRVVTDDFRCACAGPQGIAGPLGPTGSIGATGLTGPTGPTGEIAKLLTLSIINAACLEALRWYAPWT